MLLSALNSMPRFIKSQTRAPIMLNYLVVLLTPKQTSCCHSPWEVSKLCTGKIGQPNEANLLGIIGKKASLKKGTMLPAMWQWCKGLEKYKILNPMVQRIVYFPCTKKFTISLSILTMCACVHTHTKPSTHIHMHTLHSY